MTAQVVTKTEPTLRQAIAKVKWDWLATDAGAVVSKTTRGFTGAVVRAVFVPYGGGTAPTAAYDVTITDDDGLDVLNGLGADLSATATVQKTQTDGLQWVANSALTLNVSGAGDANGGMVYLLIVEFNEPG